MYTFRRQRRWRGAEEEGGRPRGDGGGDVARPQEGGLVVLLGEGEQGRQAGLVHASGGGQQRSSLERQLV